MFAVSTQYRHRGPLVLNHVSLAFEAGTLTRVQGENLGSVRDEENL